MTWTILFLCVGVLTMTFGVIKWIYQNTGASLPPLIPIRPDPPHRLTQEDVDRCLLEAQVEVGLKVAYEVKIPDGYEYERIEHRTSSVEIMEFGSSEIIRIPTYDIVRGHGRVPKYRTEIRYRDAGMG